MPASAYLEVMLHDLPSTGVINALITKNGIGVQTVFAVVRDLDKNVLYIARVAGPAISADLLSKVSESLWNSTFRGEDSETRFRWVQCEGGPSPQTLGSLLQHGTSVWPA